MKLKHKALVRIVYPKAICLFESVDTPYTEGYSVYDKPGGGGRQLGFSKSAWGAWFAAYGRFSKAQKAKANA